MNGLQTWVINLDRAPQRLARVSGQLQRLALPFERWPAVDAQQLTVAQNAWLDAPGYHRKHGKRPVPGELGCYLSHLQVMAAFLATKATCALVLEDDVLLHDTLPGVLQGLLQHPAHWDVVKLSAVHSGTPVSVLALDAAAPGHTLAVMLSTCTGSSAYLINRKAAQAFVAGLLPMQLPYDHAFDQAWLFDLQLRLVVPTPCTHDDRIASTIGTPTKERKFRWTQRLPTYAFRMRKAARRLLYGLSQLANERMRKAA